MTAFLDEERGDDPRSYVRLTRAQRSLVSGSLVEGYVVGRRAAAGLDLVDEIEHTQTGERVVVFNDEALAIVGAQPGHLSVFCTCGSPPCPHRTSAIIIALAEDVAGPAYPTTYSYYQMWDKTRNDEYVRMMRSLRLAGSLTMELERASIETIALDDDQMRARLSLYLGDRSGSDAAAPVEFRRTVRQVLSHGRR
ncbi:hypothetical protein [Miltoncostaea oceani]|uniref:hypothetical protein n=1 Tax=Miltoncostaea oceani TaxID=2843216 RepID=UPI001C3C2591|nr:hypothetical protein [Miltoncostaea oceani]